MEENYIVKSFVLRKTNKLIYTDNRLGEVYKCLDQNNQRQLLHITEVSNNNAMISKFYLNEININVFLYFYNRKNCQIQNMY